MNFRTYQLINIICFTFLSALATFLHELTKSWAEWAIINLVMVLFMILSYRAAKLEVLDNIGMTLQVYERIMEQRAAKRLLKKKVV